MHDLHDTLPGYDPEAILFDGCERCEKRAAKGVAGLLELDQGNLDLLWRRCLNTEYSGSNGGMEAGEYRSRAEHQLGHNLYLIGVLENVWNPERFAQR
jgi:hypothetical protein